ncbi:MAG: hypothetical protein IT287_00085 [Bdellovibrionaceae bacterium]|nr:hypothetical protein [Pseudobdellovibrionaceae bacterium]
MEKKRFTTSLFFLVPIIAVVFLAYYARQKNSDTVTFKIDPAPPQQATRVSASDDADSIGMDGEGNLITDSKQELEPLQKWVSGEAVSLNRTAVNLEAHDREITEKVKNFGAHQLAQLQKIALNESAPMNERILSTYMIGQSEQGRQHLVDIAARETNLSVGKPHSEEEIKYTQERSQKIMAVDAIFKRADTIENRLADLQQVINKTNDALIKDYAVQKSNELKK